MAFVAVNFSTKEVLTTGKERKWEAEIVLLNKMNGWGWKLTDKIKLYAIPSKYEQDSRDIEYHSIADDIEYIMNLITMGYHADCLDLF
jgi:hypothetical protein